jgi:hypothetical protein
MVVVVIASEPVGWCWSLAMLDEDQHDGHAAT